VGIRFTSNFGGGAMGPGPSWAEALRARANSNVDGSINEKDIFTVRPSDS